MILGVRFVTKRHLALSSASLLGSEWHAFFTFIRHLRLRFLIAEISVGWMVLPPFAVVPP